MKKISDWAADRLEDAMFWMDDHPQVDRVITAAYIPLMFAWYAALSMGVYTSIINAWDGTSSRQAAIITTAFMLLYLQGERRAK